MIGSVNNPGSMNLVIFGGTGLIGQRLAKAAVENGHTVWIPSRGHRSPEWGTLLPFDKNGISRLLAEIEPPYAIVNLAGESIQNGRWTAQRKKLIYNSRVHLTESIVTAISSSRVKPVVFASGSAIGYYGYDETRTFTENDAPGTGFLAKVSTDWEGATLRAQEHTRVVLLRTGVVFSEEGGALPSIVQPYRLNFGGRVGSGRQWVSWIHIEDAARLILHAVQSAGVTGPINLTAPHPVRMDELGRTVAKVLRKPHWFPVPGLGMRLLFGSKAEIVLLGQKVLPTVAESTGFRYRFPQLQGALTDLLAVEAGQ